MTTAVKVSPAEYLKLERNAEFKSEYIDGIIQAMPGASREHNLIETNLLRELSSQLKDHDCEVYGSNMKVRTRVRYSYPDATVICGQPLFEDMETDVLLNPTVIFEVLSSSTEGYDRGDKFAAYRERKSLQLYILVSQYMPRVEMYQRQAKGWHFSDVNGLDASISLGAITCTLNLSEIYDKVKFPSEVLE